jgi:hypothetical protein
MTQMDTEEENDPQMTQIVADREKYLQNFKHIYIK